MKGKTSIAAAAIVAIVSLVPTTQPLAQEGPPAVLMDDQKSHSEYMSSIAGLVARIKEVDFDYEAERTARDPMEPLVKPIHRHMKDARQLPKEKITLRDLDLTGILWDRHKPMAVVSARGLTFVVSRGDSIDSSIVVDDIEESRVFLRSGEVRTTLEMPSHASWVREMTPPLGQRIEDSSGNAG